MDGDGFSAWVDWWYEEVINKSNGPWLLILDNFSGHDELQELENVTYVFLPANTTATYQPLDQGVISHTKIKYRSIILRETVDIVARMQQPNHGWWGLGARAAASRSRCNEAHGSCMGSDF